MVYYVSQQQAQQQMSGVQKKIYGSGSATTLIISNDDIKEILKIVKSLEDSGVLLKGVTETIHNDISEQKGGFPSMLLGILGAYLLGDLLTKNLSSKGVIKLEKEQLELVMDLRGLH